MRITGGQAKGRILATPKGRGIRPTSDRVREAIFNIIGQDLSGACVLDLFAGTGSLALEALSRGARRALLIDSAPRAIRLIRRNLSLCGFEERGDVLMRDLRRGVPWNHPLLRETFDLVFLDPPYRGRFIAPLLEELAASGRLATASRLIAETSKAKSPPTATRGLRLCDTRTYGDTKISIYDHGVKNE
jgi:16S rRNA (guanine966-N2)-methyltransferase